MLKHNQDNRSINLSDFLSTTNILTLHNINNKKQLFTKISNISEKNVNISKSKLLALLLNKEMNETSGIGEGAAILNIQISEVKNIFGVFIKLNKSINFNSIDNEPVDLIFTLISPKNNQPNHLYVLAFLSRLFKDKKKLKNLRASLDKETIYAILTNKL
jgi:nitrogen PTS system EIIA component